MKGHSFQASVAFSFSNKTTRTSHHRISMNLCSLSCLVKFCVQLVSQFLKGKPYLTVQNGRHLNLFIVITSQPKSQKYNYKKRFYGFFTESDYKSLAHLAVALIVITIKEKTRWPPPGNIFFVTT